MTRTPLHRDYPAFLAALKELILRARILAARAVNSELALLCRDIGRGIVKKQRTADFLSQRVREMVAAAPWGHHVNVLEKLAEGNG